MSTQHHDPQFSYRAILRSLDGRVIAKGCIILGDKDTDGQFCHNEGYDALDIAKHQIVEAEVEGRIYRLRDFRLCQASVAVLGALGHFDFRLDY